MIVVSDTSPLRYLVAIGGIDWLPVLFGEVICPPEVIEECLHPGAPAAAAYLRLCLPFAGSQKGAPPTGAVAEQHTVAGRR